MKRLPLHFSLLLIAVALVGCGAAASLPPSNDSASLSARFTEAVWYSEHGDPSNLAVSGDAWIAEDGVAHVGSILVNAPGNQSTYVNGAFSVTVPDRSSVFLNTRAGLSAGANSAAVFQVYVQDGVNFPKLAEVTAAPDGQLDSLAVDLSRYRGQNVLLILTVSSVLGVALDTPALWIDPQIVAK